MGNALNEEFAVLMPLLAVALEDLGALEKVILLTDLNGLWGATGGRGVRIGHATRTLRYNTGRVNHFGGVVKGPKRVVLRRFLQPVC